MNQQTNCSVEGTLRDKDDCGRQAAGVYARDTWDTPAVQQSYS